VANPSHAAVRVPFRDATAVFVSELAMAGTISLRTTDLTVSEKAGTINIEIARTGSTAGSVTVQYGIYDDTATTGLDYVASGGRVTFALGQSVVKVPVRIVDDTIAENTESFAFTLVSADGGTLLAPRTTRISILDDERVAPPPPVEPPLTSDVDLAFRPVFSGLNQPVRFAFNPTDQTQVFIAEKGGVLKVADTDTGVVRVALDLSREVNSAHDRGMLGLAIHPEFQKNPYVYVYYTVDPPEAASRGGDAGLDQFGNRFAYLDRFTLDAKTGYTTVVDGSRVNLLGGAGQNYRDVSGGGDMDFTNPIYADRPSSERFVDSEDPTKPLVINGIKQDYIKVDSRSHAGGALEFGPDGALYVTTGDGTSYNLPDPRSKDVQSLDSLSGKVLRIDPLTGNGLADNPFVKPGMDLDTNAAKVFQLGLRNPFSFAVDAEGRVIVADVGWFSWEEINIGGPGANFGWPYFEGNDSGGSARTPQYQNQPEAAAFYAGVQAGTIQVTAPFRAFNHTASEPGYQMAAIVSGDVVYTGDRYPVAFKNDLFFSDINTGNLFAIDVNDRSSVRYVGNAQGNIHFEEGADGFVYAANLFNGTITRMEIAAKGAFTVGNDTVTLPPGPSAVKALAGNDTIIVNARGDSLIDGGAGLDHVALTGVARANAQVFLTNGEDHGSQIYRLYDAVQGRDPDRDGFAWWLSELDGGSTLADIADFFLTSGEGAPRWASAVTAKEFASAAYLNVLDRFGTATEVAALEAQLKAGLTRGEAIVRLIDSAEARDNGRTDAVVISDLGRQELVDVERVIFRDGIVALDVDMDESAGEAARLYDMAFNRMPTRAELTAATRGLDGGKEIVQIAGDILAADTTLKGLSNKAFVEQLYLRGLDRPGDAGGVSYWTGRVVSDGRAVVLAEMSESEEHVAVTLNTFDAPLPLLDKYIVPGT
jgi:glucose/arabinose dehydrogenase